MGIFILERYFYIDFNGNLDVNPYPYSLVRPSDVSYEHMRNVMLSRSFEDELAFGGIAFFNPNGPGKSLAEWIIELNLTRGITLDFERYVCAALPHYSHDEDIVIMEKDLHTNEILYTNPEHTKWLDQVKQILTESGTYIGPRA